MPNSLKLTILKILSFIGLGLTIIPSILVYHLMIGHAMHVHLMEVGMVIWFITAPFWINKEKES
ncbi:MAG: hypothetical protein ACFHWX_14015 [Bacteroidota bacterium]